VQLAAQVVSTRRQRSAEEIADVFVALLERGYLSSAPDARPADDTLSRIEARLGRLETALGARLSRRAPRRK
jgi:hypothetical protein